MIQLLLKIAVRYSVTAINYDQLLSIYISINNSVTTVNYSAHLPHAPCCSGLSITAPPL